MNVCLNCKGQWERKIMNKENKLVIRILKRMLLLAVVMFLLSVVVSGWRDWHREIPCSPFTEIPWK